MDLLQDIILKSKGCLEKCEESVSQVKQECDDYFKEVDLFLKTRNADFFKLNNSGKENEPVVVTNKRKGRLRKPALSDVIENNILQPEKTSIKKEKISDIEKAPGELNINIEIKKEIEEMPAPSKLPPRKKKIKAEKLELPKRSTRTKTKKIANNEEMSSDTDDHRLTKDSDVIIENTTITTIEISDNEKETESDTDKSTSTREMRSTRSKVRKQNKAEFEQTVKESENKVNKESGDGKTVVKNRTTRTKTKQKKRVRSNSMEQPDQIEHKRSKSNSNTETVANGTIQTEYEDALSVLESNQNKLQPLDSTYIASSKKSFNINENAARLNINSTVVIENPKMVAKEMQQLGPLKPSEHDVITKTPPELAKKNGNKQIFSPFEKTPLKKKVEAFEKLGTECSGIPTRMTRTKKKLQKNQSEPNDEGHLLKPPEEKSKDSYEKEKLLTPITSKFIPKVCSTSKINRFPAAYSSNTSTSNESILSVKSASALKASQAEFRERQKQRQEKEKEALKKREALLQAQTEEKRRKREEKQQRAQQQREILEKEMQKQLEAQKLKEEKFKQAMVEREKKLQKQKEEAEKKRQLVKKKANDLLKEKEELIKIAEKKKYAEMQAVFDKQEEMTKMALKQKMERAQQSEPIYMTTKPPLLPTADCYDSDDPEYESNKRIESTWSKDRELRDMQLAMITAGETIKNSFFCRQAQTPDLQEIFGKIDPRKLKRTSSAIWRKPPRYTLMPTLEDTIEFSEESD